MSCGNPNISNQSTFVVTVPDNNTITITDTTKHNVVTAIQEVSNVIQINTPGPQGSVFVPKGSEYNVLFKTGSEASGSNNFTFNYNTNTLELTGSFNILDGNLSLLGNGYFLQGVSTTNVLKPLIGINNTNILEIGDATTTNELKGNTTLSGSLFGTASYANNAMSSSYAVSSSHALTASYVNPLQQNVIITGSLFVTQSYISTVDYIDFTSASTQPTAVGRLSWNNDDGTLNLGLKGGAVSLQIGQEQVVRVVNKTGINLTEAGYQVVRIDGAQGKRLKVALAKGDGDPNSLDTLGIVTENIALNQEGYITTMGLVRGINTTGNIQGETWNDGDALYLSPITAGALTINPPMAPSHSVRMGYIVEASNNGSIFVKVDNGYEIDELHNVLINTGSLAYGDLLMRDGNNVWINTKTLSGSYTLSGSLTTNDGVSVQTLTASFVSASQFTGSLHGTASYVTGSIFTNNNSVASASYALTASYALNSDGSTINTGSLVTTSSFNSFTSSINSFTQSINSVTSSFATTGSNTFSGSQTINGNVSINGTASIAYLNVTYESASIIYSSGSNQFGDATNDVQTLIGTVIVSGSQQITGSLTVSGSSTFTNIGPAIFSGSVTSIQGFTGSFSGSITNATTASYVTGSIFINNNLATSASYALTASYALNGGGGDTSGLVTTSSFNAFTSSVTTTSSFNTYTASAILTSSFNAFTSSVVTTSSFNSFTQSINSVTSSFVTTGSSSTSQSILGSLNITGSLGVSGSTIVRSALGTGTAFQVLSGSSPILHVGTNIFQTRVGIRTSSPQFSFDVNGNANFKPEEHSGYLRIEPGQSSTWNNPTYFQTSFGSTLILNNAYYTASGGQFIRATNGYAAGIQLEPSAGGIELFTAPYGTAGTAFSAFTSRISITNSGSVGINNTSPSHSLDVSGSGRFLNGLIVTGSLNAASITGSLQGTASWATNFVSASNYVLNSATSSFVSVGSTGTTSTVSGSLIINQNLTVLGTSSIQYVTSSQLDIGTNIITVNTATPAIRFGGLAVYDSGSTGTGRTGSILWDSQNDNWIYSNPSGSSYDGAVILVGPRNTTGLGNEAYINSGYAAVGNGGHHMTSSAIYSSGSLIRLENNTQVTGSLIASGGFTGSLLGTSSWSENSVTASYINPTFISASAAASGFGSGGGSSTPAFPYTGSATITGSLTITGSTTSTRGFTGSLHGTASWATNALTASTVQGMGSYNVTQSFTNASTWTFNHNLGYKTVIVQAYDSTDAQIIPQNIVLTNTNTATLTFPVNVSGYAVATVGGTLALATASFTQNAVSASYATTSSATTAFDGAWTSYTPIWSTPSNPQPSIGDGTLTGAYKQIGKTVFVRVRLLFGTTTTGGTGDWRFSLPVTASSAAGIQFPCSILDAGNAWYQATVNGQYGGETFRTSIIGQSSGANSSQGVTSVFPITWGNLDSLQFNGSYEAL